MIIKGNDSYSQELLPPWVRKEKQNQVNMKIVILKLRHPALITEPPQFFFVDRVLKKSFGFIHF